MIEQDNHVPVKEDSINEGLTLDYLRDLLKYGLTNRTIYKGIKPVIGCGKLGAIKIVILILKELGQSIEYIDEIKDKLKRILPDGQYLFEGMECTCPDGIKYPNIMHYAIKLKKNNLSNNAILVCEECGSEDIQTLMWVNPNNTSQVDGELDSGDTSNNYCRNCQENVGITSKEEYLKNIQIENNIIEAEKNSI